LPESRQSAGSGNENRRLFARFVAAHALLSSWLEDAMIVLKRILVATDFGPAAGAALTYGRALAHSFGATLHVMHVAENFFLRPTVADPHALKAAAARRLEECLTAEDRTSLHAHALLETSDHAADTIAGYAKDANIDLIVIGTHGREGLSHVLFGSVAERVVRTAACPVLTVKHPEHEFVVSDAATGSQEARPS
jgi:nucleotide-binding universal stress UspA family protein